MKNQNSKSVFTAFARRLILPGIALLALTMASNAQNKSYNGKGRSIQKPPPRYQPPTTKPKPPVKPPVRSYGEAYNEGDKLFNIGIGVSSSGYGGTPIGLSYESGITEDISVGVQFDYSSGRDNSYYYSNRYYNRYRAYYLGARATYHLNRLLDFNDSNLDLYVGAGLGYRSVKWDYSYYSYNSGLSLNGFIGGKYYFTPKTSGFVELGYVGLSWSRIGVAFKF